VKGVLSTVMCVLLALALAAFAVGSGAVRGWSGEREKALHILTGDSRMAGTLANRAMDAANLAVVAARHLPQEDVHLQALRHAHQVLTGGHAAAAELAQADAALTETALALAEALPQLATVQASQRDQVYIATLTRTLAEGTDASGAYLAAAEDFNARMQRSLTGRLAMLLGVELLAAQ